LITDTSVLPSGSHKCLRFSLWSTLHTLKDVIYLLIVQNFYIFWNVAEILSYFDWFQVADMVDHMLRRRQINWRRTRTKWAV